MKMKFELLEKHRLPELSGMQCLEVSPLSRLENHSCDVSDSIGKVLKIESLETSIYFKSGMKLPSISWEAIDGARPTLEFFKKLELGIVGETDKLLATTEGYVMANWKMDEIYGGKVTEKGALFQPKAFSDKIKVYRDPGRDFSMHKSHQAIWHNSKKSIDGNEKGIHTYTKTTSVTKLQSNGNIIVSVVISPYELRQQNRGFRIRTIGL